MKAFLLLLLVLLAADVQAQSSRVSKAGTTAGAFLTIGVGPRATAMGGAFVAAADDASALYWNPAGLARLGGSEVLAAHSEWLADITFDYLGGAFAVGGHRVGVAVTMLSMPDMVVRTEDRQEGTGATFDAADMALALTYGRAVTDRFSIGGTFKYVQQRIMNSSAQGFAVDLGTQFRTDFFGGLTIGAALYNFGTDLRLDGRDLRTFVDPDEAQEGNNGRIPAEYAMDGWSLPLDFQIGIATRPLDSRMHRLTLALDALHPSANFESVNVGAEYGFRERFFLRGGFENAFLDESEGGLTGGVAVHQPLPYRDGMLKIDYGYRQFGRLGGIHVVGLSVGF